MNADKVALAAAREIEDALWQGHPGGRVQLLARIQTIVIHAIEVAVASQRIQGKVEHLDGPFPPARVQAEPVKGCSASQASDSSDAGAAPADHVERPPHNSPTVDAGESTAHPVEAIAPPEAAGLPSPGENQPAILTGVQDEAAVDQGRDTSAQKEDVPVEGSSAGEAGGSAVSEGVEHPGNSSPPPVPAGGGTLVRRNFGKTHRLMRPKPAPEPDTAPTPPAPEPAPAPDAPTVAPQIEMTDTPMYSLSAGRTKVIANGVWTCQSFVCEMLALLSDGKKHMEDDVWRRGGWPNLTTFRQRLPYIKEKLSDIGLNLTMDHEGWISIRRARR